MVSAQMDKALWMRLRPGTDHRASAGMLTHTHTHTHTHKHTDSPVEVKRMGGSSAGQLVCVCVYVSMSVSVCARVFGWWRVCISQYECVCVCMRV